MNKEMRIDTIEKAVYRAVKNGWTQGKELLEDFELVDASVDLPGYGFISGRVWYEGYAGSVNIEAVIFNHGFARALFGSRCIAHIGNKHPGPDHKLFPCKYEWQMHLEKMVVSEEPIMYLFNNMPE